MTTEDIIREFELAESSGNIGALTVKPANVWIDDASKKPDPVTYFHGMIVEGENTVIFAPTNVGKSILAVMIAEEIAMTHMVIYIDLESTDKQFQKRYTDEGIVHRFPDNFLRAEIRPEHLLELDLEESIMESIRLAADMGAKFVILDNITFACIRSEKAEVAGEFMRKLNHLKRKYGLTLICISHTTKIHGYKPLDEYDMAGSSKLISLFDAGIAIGRSAKDPHLRYIKQVKVRDAEHIFNSENVMVCEITKVDGWLHLDIRGYERENIHLRVPENDLAKDELYDKVKELVRNGYSVRKIESELNLTHGTAQRLCSRARQENIDKSDKVVPTVPDVPLDTVGTVGTEDDDMPLF